MSRPRWGVVLFLTWRWVRSTGARRSAAILVVTFAVLGAVFVGVSAFTLSSHQQGDEVFGRFEQQTYTAVSTGQLPPGFLTRADAALSRAVPGSHLLIETDAIRPDVFAKTYVQAPLATLHFVQDASLRAAFPNRYTLAEGSWPRAPFEVLVSEHVLDQLPNHHQFTVLSGRVTLHVVGVVTDAYAKHDDTIIAGRNTWESIPSAAPGHASRPTTATLNVLWGPGPSRAEVDQALRNVLPPNLRHSVHDLAVNHTSRAELTAQPVEKFGTGQLVISYLPLLMVVLLVSVLVVGQTRSTMRTDTDRLLVLGIRRQQVKLTQVLALLLVTAGSIVVGLTLGWLLAILLRATVLSYYADQPLSPVPGLDAKAVAICACALLIVALGTLLPTSPRKSLKPTTSPAPRPGDGKSATAWLSSVPRLLSDIHTGTIRRVAVVLLMIAAVQVGGGVRSVLASYLAVAAVLLLSPDLLRLIVAALPRGHHRSFVIGRLMQVDYRRQAAAVVVVSCCLAIPICAATQLTSEKTAQARFTYSVVPAGQIWVLDGDIPGGDIAGVVRAISTVNGLGQPVAVYETIAPSRADYTSSGASAFLTEYSTTESHTSSRPMVVTSADQVARLLGSQFPAHATTVLNNGGILDFSQATAAQRFAVADAHGNSRFTTPRLPTLEVPVSQQIQASFGGAVLLRTARQLKLPIYSPRTYIYTGITPRITKDSVQAAVNAGYDSGFVQYNVPPPPPTLPANAYVFLAGLVLGGFAILMFVIRGQANRLRTYSARLVAIGLGPRWTLSILTIQAAVILGTGLVAGIAGGILGVKLSSAHYPVTVVPVLPIALACGATCIAAVLATALSIRTLTATEHPQVT